MEGMGLIFTPLLVRRLIGPPVLSRPMTSTSWTHSYVLQTVSIGWYNPSPASHPPHPLIREIRDITVVLNKVT